MLYDYALLLSILGMSIIGFITPLIGTFALLNKQSLLGDTLCHASLPGILIMLIVTGTRSLPLLIFGGALSSLLASIWIHYLLSKTTLKKDTCLGITIASFFGAGLVLLTLLQKQHSVHQAIVTPLFLGNSFLLPPQDIGLLTLLSLVMFASISICWKEYKLVCFDPEFTHTIGYSPQFVSLMLIIHFALTIAIALNSMGIMLTSNLMIAPAIIARQWCNHVESMALVASIIGASASALGFFISSQSTILSPGPTIVLIISCSALASFSLTGAKKQL